MLQLPSIRTASVADAPALAALVEAVFVRSVAPDYTEDGQATFRDYANAEALAERLAAGAPVFVAVDRNGAPVGMIELRPPAHIALFFVRNECQGHGVGRRLLAAATMEAARQPAAATLTVNSSPGAVGAYERLGFAATGPERVHKGLRFTPMARALGPATPSGLPTVP